jgi:glutathione reductase (NADPH)
MSQFDFDLIVIGAGSGGVRAARIAAAHGARVAIIEESRVGGTCVIRGCVPKKLLMYASHYAEDFEDARGFGWETGPSRFSWPDLIRAKDKEIARLNQVYLRLLSESGVALYSERACFLDPHRIRVGDESITAGHVLIATGGHPWVPDIPGIEFAITSNEAFDLEQLPPRVAIVGGGYIACEFAGIFNGLGAQVTQLYRGPLFLRGFDSDIRAHAAQETAKTGVDLRFETNVESIRPDAQGLAVQLTDGSVLEADVVLYATGRKPHLQGLGLENVNVQLSEFGTVLVDGDYRTTEPSIFALGDVTGGLELTPVALAEGMAFARHQFGGQETQVDYDFIPTAVFCQPNIGTVGFTEDEARAKFGHIRLFKSTFKPMKHTLSGRDEMTFMKLIVDKASDRVVGVHMVGPDAGEIMQGVAIALRAGATKATFDSTIGIHPTAAEEFVTMREPWTED